MTADERWVVVARIVRSRGLRGELVADGVAENPERFFQYRNLEAYPPSEKVTVERVRAHQGRLFFKLEGVDTVEQAERFRDRDLRIPRSDLPPPPPGEFYLGDLIGCRVIEVDSDEELGSVTDCLEYGGPVLLEVRQGDREILVPFVPAICLETSIVEKRITVRLPEGLKDL